MMKKIMSVLLLGSLLILFAGCGGGGDDKHSAPKEMESFSLAGVEGTINKGSIEVTVPYDTNVTALAATFTYTGAKMVVEETEQESGVTVNNFTTSVVYTVVGDDGSTKDYTVAVTIAPSSEKTMKTFSLAGVNGEINETAKTIAVTLPNGTAVTNLAATFTATGVSVKVGEVVQVSGQTPNDFTGSVVYTVMAADDSTQIYTVTVTVETERQKATAITVVMKANNPLYVDNGDPEVFCTRTISIKAYHTVTPNDGRTVIYWQFLKDGQIVKEGTNTLAELQKTPPELENKLLFTTGSRITYKATADGAVSASDNASIT